MDAQTYKIKVKLMQGTSLKGVRAYMVLSKLQEYGDIIESTPEIEALEKGDFDDVFEIIFNSKELEQGIIEDIQNISEIETVDLEQCSDFTNEVAASSNQIIDNLPITPENQVTVPKEKQQQVNEKVIEEVEKKYIVFQISSEECALPIDYVMSIERNIKVTRVPNLPAHIVGVINLRGIVIPVIDLKYKFSKTKMDITDATRIIVCRYNSLDVGFFVDAAKDVLTVHNDLIEAAPDLEKSEATEYIESLIHMEKRIIIILNVEKIFKQ